jgi:two-component system cell cycle response regulator DivK
MVYILVVEDNLPCADMMLRLLQAVGFEVKHASRGMRAAQLARRERPALILMDLDLPEVSGLTAIRVIRKQLGENTPHIVAVTAHCDSTHRKAARQAGCIAFVAKPFSPQDLLDTVNSLLLPASEATPQDNGPLTMPGHQSVS